MGPILHLLTYACMAVFVVAVVQKFLKYKNMPMHLRWELYPVAHEGHKAHYGGSYFEELDWWEKERTVDMGSEMRHMLPEMLFLVAVKEHNAKLWLRTFPFHFGMYCLIGFLCLMIGGAIAGLAGLDLSSGGIGTAYGTLLAVTGFAGAGLGIIGALGLLARRLGDELRDFSKPSDIFNLVFLMSVFVLIIAAGATDPYFTELRQYVQSVIAFDLSYAPQNPAAIGAVALASLVVAYIPLTHMSHFIAKYFTYHNIRWDDEPNIPGRDTMGDKIAEVLQYEVTWAADHINPHGEKKTWADVATETPEELKESK